MTRLEKAKRRLDRVGRRIEALAEKHNEFMEATPFEIKIEDRIEGTSLTRIFTAHNIKELPEDFAEEIGIVVHLMRAPCDWIISELAELSGYGSKPNINFPIYRDDSLRTGAEKFAEYRIQRKKLGKPILDTLEQLQPYTGCRDSNGLLWIDGLHPMVILTELWNTEKHHFEAELACVQVDHGGGMYATGSTNGPSVMMLTVLPKMMVKLGEGEEFFRTVLETRAPVEFVPHFNFGAVLNGINSPAGINAVELVSLLLVFVRDLVIPTLEPFLLTEQL